jgi:hypothetical protein
MEVYTTRKGCFKKEELSKLASALGFPSNIFIKELRKSSSYCFESDHARLEDGKAITAEGLNHVIESGALNHRLEKIFNKYDAQYNIKVIVKAVTLLADRQLSFSEVAIARMAFEVYCMEDGSGLPAELRPVSQALKLMDRVMAPTRLEAEIAKQQHYCELPSRIQMYEFYDLAVRCLKLSEAEREMEVQIGRNVNDDSALTTASSDTSLPDISKMLMTTDQRILDYLDERYKSSMFKKVDPTPSPLDDQRIISMAPRRMLRSMSKEHSCAIVPPLERSQQQLHQARSGRGMVLSATQYASVEGSIQSSRPHTSLSMDHRTRNISMLCSSRLSQNAMQWRRNQTPSSRLTDRSMKDPVFLSKSAPNILLDRGEENISDRAMDSTGDIITDAISKICVDSVYRAREAVCSSVASLPQVEAAVDNRRGSVLVSDKLCRRRLSRRLCTPTLPIVRLTPIITKEEMKRHHDSISELEWDRLRKAKKVD